MIFQYFFFLNRVHIQYPGGGGGGGGTWVFRVLIRSLSKFKNTPKALISGQKCTLILKKRWLFPVKNTPSFIKTQTLDEREHAF